VPLKHSTTAQASSPYACLIMWKASLRICLILGRTWRFPVAQAPTFSISAARRQLPFTTVTFFLNTLHARNCFLLGREQKGHGTISWLHVSAVVHNKANMRPVHEIIDYTTYSYHCVKFVDIYYTEPKTGVCLMQYGGTMKKWICPRMSGTMKEYGQVEGMLCEVLNHCTRQSWMISFTLWPF
jgi:hypothetical protein